MDKLLRSVAATEVLRRVLVVYDVSIAICCGEGGPVIPLLRVFLRARIRQNALRVVSAQTGWKIVIEVGVVGVSAEAADVWCASGTVLMIACLASI